MSHIQSTHQIGICTYGEPDSIKSIHPLQQTTQAVHGLVTVGLTPQCHLGARLQQFAFLSTYTQGRCHRILIPATHDWRTACRNSRRTYLIIGIDKYENPATRQVYGLVHGMVNAGIRFTHQTGYEPLPVRTVQISHAAII